MSSETNVANLLAPVPVLYYHVLMISLLTGTIIDLGNKYAVLDIHGIGYKVFVTDDTLHAIKMDVQMTLWTHMAVREDAQDLYGFTSKKERDFFELLISISGIGPKSALNILSLVSVETLVTSVRTGSVAHLVKVSGIGRKTAEKIVLELKEKLGGMSSEGGENWQPVCLVIWMLFSHYNRSVTTLTRLAKL